MVAVGVLQAQSAFVGCAGFRAQPLLPAPVNCNPRTALRQRRRSGCRRGCIRAAVMAPQHAGLKTYKASEMSVKDLQEATARPRIDFASILSTVEPIVQSVKERGDAAVKEYTQRFDGVAVDAVCTPIEELGEPKLDQESRDAFDRAYDNIRAFHAAQQVPEMSVETMSGVHCRRVSRPIGAVGVYVPGGTAVLPSSALMLSVPAGLAGCDTIVLATPPRSNGCISPEVLYCAKKAGVTHVLRAGGAQAVAALAWGTESCPKVDKILGPGNQYVTAAKMLLQNSEAMISMDMPAGPSEVLVIADAAASPVFIAADLLSQAEHGPDSQVVLVALPGVDLEAVQREVDAQCDALPRGDTARQALSHSCVVRVDSQAEAVEFSNRYAPEHLIINTQDAEEWLPLVDNAGSVFLGPWTPESVGDYASGTNHVLPTYGYARMYSGVSLDSFQKKMTVQTLTPAGLQGLGPTVAHMAALEGLDAHKRAVTLRLDALKNGAGGSQ